MASRTITNTAEELVPQNPQRLSLVVQNEDTAINIFLKVERPGGNTVTTTDHDIILGPGSTLAVNVQEDGPETVQERWTVIAASGTPRISIFESESIER